MSWISEAYAMGAGQAGAGQEGSLLTSLMPFAIIFVIFYFLLIRPQQKKAKEEQQMLSGLKKGDAVLTLGGMYGRIVDVDGDVMVVDLGETKVKMVRSALRPAPTKQAAPVPAKKEKKGKKGDKNDAKEAPAEVEAAPAAEETPAVETPAEIPAASGDAPASSDDDKGKPAA